MADAPDGECLAVTVAGTTQTLGGDVFIHEHLIFDHSCRLEPQTDLDLAALRDQEIVLEKMALFRNSARSTLTNLRSPPAALLGDELATLVAGRPKGCCAMVDCSIGPGRDLAGLHALSRSTPGVHIIASAGIAPDAASATTDDEALEAEVDRLVHELTRGVEIVVPGTANPIAVRCGMLVAGDAAFAPGRAREVCLHAVGQAQMRTGAPLLLALPAHVASASFGGGASVLDLVRTLTETHGAAARRIIIGHTQNLLIDTSGGGAQAPPLVAGSDTGSIGRSVLVGLLNLGVSLCFDNFGVEWGVAGVGALPNSGLHGPIELSPFALPPPSDEAVVREVCALASAGHAPQLLLSQGIWTRLQLEAYGGTGWRHLRRNIVPRLTRAGLPQGTAGLGALLAGNATRLLAWWVPTTDAPRLCKIWECIVCHQRFEEAVHPEDALPTDQVYYEKFDNRYCGTACLSTHRKAGWKIPLS